MAAAQGPCPGCGAPIEFRAGSSVSSVCTFCKSTVRRTDRGLENLGRIADLVDTPSIVAVGDSGTLLNQSFVVLGRVQLAHDLGGVWEEWYLGFTNGTWGWLAYAQGVFMVTWKLQPAPPVPEPRDLRLEANVPLGQAGSFRVVELKQAIIASAEGELPFSPRAGEVRSYADLVGPRVGFATIDWGSGNEPVEVFVGYQLLESQLQITQQVERPHRHVALEGINCPSCGAPLKLFGGSRIERVACQYCGAVSDSASQAIIARQDAARTQPLIPLGTSGVIANVQYIVIGFVQRSSVIEDETFSWGEYLLFSPGLGFRWLVDDEGTWRFTSPLNASELDLSRMPNYASLQGRTYRLRNSNIARVDYVIGEFYWKVQVGEAVQVMDFEMGSEVISREAQRSEVHWSSSPVIPWATLASAFGIRAAQPLGAAGTSASSSGRSGVSCGSLLALVIGLILVLVFLGTCTGMCGGGGSSGGGVRGGGAPVFGGGWSSGK